jgi:predicted alpha/beta superfamily hydrolase
MKTTSGTGARRRVRKPAPRIAPAPVWDATLLPEHAKGWRLPPPTPGYPPPPDRLGQVGAHRGAPGGFFPTAFLRPGPSVTRPWDTSVHGPGIVGDVRLHRQIPSMHLPYPRDVWVWLPPGYANETRRRHPVIYMHDGNNLFDARTAFLGRKWGADVVADRLITNGEIPSVIIVGVGNTPDRVPEYTWVKSTRPPHEGGNGARYANFLVEELKPFIDNTYRTYPDAGSTATLGSSLGGLIAGYLGIYHPGTFSRVALVSPSIWWADRRLIADIEGIDESVRVWLDIGMHERMLGDARALHKKLIQRGFRDGENLGYMEDPDGEHDEPSWGRRLPAILRFLWDGWAPPQ